MYERTHLGTDRWQHDAEAGCGKCSRHVDKDNNNNNNNIIIRHEERLLWGSRGFWNKQTNKKSRGACNVMDNSSRTALTDSVILSSVLRTSGRNDVNMLYFSKMTNMAFVYKYTWGCCDWCQWHSWARWVTFTAWSNDNYDNIELTHCGVIPKGLLTFLGFLGDAEFSPWNRLPEFIELELRKS